jgi:hypothetical protein
VSERTKPDYLTMQQAAERLPDGRHGGPVYPTTVTKWILYGVKITGGHTVYLKGIRLPGGWRTTAAWVDEFLETLTRASLEEARKPKADPARDAIRQFEADKALERLARKGLKV